MLTLWVLQCVLQTFLAVLRKTPLPTRTSCPAEVGLVERFISCGGVTAKALIKAALDGDPTVSPTGALSSAGIVWSLSLFPTTPHPSLGLFWTLYCDWSHGAFAFERLPGCIVCHVARIEWRHALRNNVQCARHNGLLRQELRS
jgi:hypothetical protein